MVGQQWQGRKWYCYGTSMTDNHDRNGNMVGSKPDGMPNRPQKTGFYSRFLAELAGLEEHNFGNGSAVLFRLSTARIRLNPV